VARPGADVLTGGHQIHNGQAGFPAKMGQANVRETTPRPDGAVGCSGRAVEGGVPSARTLRSAAPGRPGPAQVSSAPAPGNDHKADRARRFSECGGDVYTEGHIRACEGRSNRPRPADRDTTQTCNLLLPSTFPSPSFSPAFSFFSPSTSHLRLYPSFLASFTASLSPPSPSPLSYYIFRIFRPFFFLGLLTCPPLSSTTFSSCCPHPPLFFFSPLPFSYIF